MSAEMYADCGRITLHTYEFEDALGLPQPAKTANWTPAVEEALLQFKCLEVRDLK